MSDQSGEASNLQNTVAFLSIALAVVLLFYAKSRHVRRETNAPVTTNLIRA